MLLFLINNGLQLAPQMNKKPDTMLTMIVIFCLGLIISGFSSMSVGYDDHRVPEQVLTRY